MILKWLRQKKKIVVFRSDELDQALLEAVKTELARQPGLGFSNLCKEALRRLLLDRPLSSGAAYSPMEKRLENLEAQLQSVEQRFFAQEKKRLERLETQLQQLAIQMAQLGSTVPAVAVSSQALSEATPDLEVAEAPPIEDPILSRLSSLIDDF